MMKTLWIVAAAAALAGCTQALGEEARRMSRPTPGEIVAARQAAFQMSGAAMGNMRAAMERGADVSSQAYAARGVARWAQALPAMFPESSAAVTPSRARPEIWRNKADFNAKAAAYAEAAAKLAELAKGDDKAAFAAQLKATGATCGACHDLYQAPAEPPAA